MTTHTQLKLRNTQQLRLLRLVNSPCRCGKTGYRNIVAITDVTPRISNYLFFYYFFNTVLAIIEMCPVLSCPTQKVLNWSWAFGVLTVKIGALLFNSLLNIIRPQSLSPSARLPWAPIRSSGWWWWMTNSLCPDQTQLMCIITRPINNLCISHSKYSKHRQFCFHFKYFVIIITLQFIKYSLHKKTGLFLLCFFIQKHWRYSVFIYRHLFW